MITANQQIDNWRFDMLERLINNGLVVFSQLGLLTVSTTLMAFAILERVIPATPKQPLWAYLLNLRISILYIFISFYYLGSINASIIEQFQRHFGSGLLDLRFSAGHNIIIQVMAGLLAVIVSDFFYYWFHRLQHTIPVLWAQHKVHHLDEHLNASSSMRVHWLEELFRLPFIAIPLAIFFKLDPMPTGIFGILFASWGYFIHANIRLELGVFTRFIGAPQVHRIHHSIEEQHFNKNYAAFFPIWDVIFRTYYHPKPGEFPRTGIAGERLSKARDAALLPFDVWMRKIKKILRLRTIVK